MSKRLNQSYKSVQTNKIAIRETPETGIVTEVILDDTHKLIRSKEDSTKSIYTETVSYTHLTLPTNREV